jgi:hypothetical protein
MSMNWDQYSVVAFIDSNIALECLALEQLPWKELDSKGPILVLVAPAVLQEVDSKKNHPRLGDHARRFNRTLRPLLEGAATSAVREAPIPRVEIAFADVGRVDWDQYPDLDRDEADARVVAQVLCARGPMHERRVLVSHDIRPLQLAGRHGLKIHQIGDNWLRPKEISEADKKAANLQREIDAMKKREPNLALSLTTSRSVVDVHRVKELSHDERKEITRRIIRLRPMPKQEASNGVLSWMGNFDHTLDERYERWERKTIPEFVRQYERKLELNFGQFQIRFRIDNVGQVPAESLLIRLHAMGGWLNEKFVLATPMGPSAPKPRPSRDLYGMHIPPSVYEGVRSLAPPGKHEFVVLEEPKRSDEVQIACADFRHGFDYEYSVVGRADPWAEEFRVSAIVTAANLYGQVETSVIVTKNGRDSAVADLIDMETMSFFEAPDVDGLLEEAITARDFSAFEFDGSKSDQ